MTRSEKGFSLLEVLGAATIVALILIPIFIMFYEGVGFVSSSKDKNLATNFAQEKMEYLRNKAYDDHELQDGTYSDTRTAGGKIFNREVTIVSSPSEITNSNADIKRITVRVSWTREGQTQAVILVTYRARKL
ncbi:MAG: prepilin-type N-terminal cleavage/methylation domain-containing protein [Actinomycetota bacterium]|nr:prepilin-type N-terminal cleavage/methylation domain-containing protein [Actinomycetota bacterium]